ncbi:MAG: hypothetical protein ABI541_06390 [Betaproteobacteria bacterium]
MRWLAYSEIKIATIACALRPHRAELRSYVCDRIDRSKGFADHPHVNFALACHSGQQKFVGFARRFRFNETRRFSVLRLAVVDGH